MYHKVYFIIQKKFWGGRGEEMRRGKISKRFPIEELKNGQGSLWLAWTEARTDGQDGLMTAPPTGIPCSMSTRRPSTRNRFSANSWTAFG